MNYLMIICLGCSPLRKNELDPFETSFLSSDVGTEHAKGHAEADGDDGYSTSH